MEPEVNIGCLPQLLSTLYFKAGPFTRTQSVAGLPGLTSQLAPNGPVSIPQTLWLQAGHNAHLAFVEVLDTIDPSSQTTFECSHRVCSLPWQ